MKRKGHRSEIGRLHVVRGPERYPVAAVVLNGNWTKVDGQLTEFLKATGKASQEQRAMLLIKLA